MTSFMVYDLYGLDKVGWEVWDTLIRRKDSDNNKNKSGKTNNTEDLFQNLTCHVNEIARKSHVL